MSKKKCVIGIGNSKLVETSVSEVREVLRSAEERLKRVREPESKDLKRAGEPESKEEKLKK